MTKRWMSSARLTAVLAVMAACIVSQSAAQQADSDRCEGTLCDLYYGSRPPGQQAAQGTKPAESKPLMVPNGGILGFFSGGTAQQGAPGAAPAKRPMVGVGGGGLAAMARGDAPERCSGTLCDFYYGGPPPEPSPDRSAPVQSTTATAAPAVDPGDDIEPAPRDVQYRRQSAPPEPTRCVASGRDPWACYR